MVDTYQPWEVDRWIEIVENGLYPPVAFTESQAVLPMMSLIDFKGKMVLDAGCGTGRWARIAKERGGIVKGMDIDKNLVDYASRFIDAKVGDAREISYDNDTFDVVLSINVDMIFPEISQAISEKARVLKPGGDMIFGVVHPYAPAWDLDTLKMKEKPDNFPLEVEKRTWVFHLTDGTYTTADYYNRPLGSDISDKVGGDSYVGMLLEHFKELGRFEPRTYGEFLTTGKYADPEYIFFRLKKMD